MYVCMYIIHTYMHMYMHTNIYFPFIFPLDIFCQLLYWWDSEARFKQHISSNLEDNVGQ